MNPKNPKIYRQADSRWGSLPYPTKNYTFAHNGCGCCAVTHCVIEQDKYKDLTPADVRKYMVKHATKGHGTTWAGIKDGLEHYGYNVHWRQADTMADIWKVLNGESLKRGIILFGSTKGPDGTVWTNGGHYISFCDYEVKDGKHYFYLKDSGGRKHDKAWCYEKSMKGDVRQVFICTSLKEEEPKEEPKDDVTYEKYSGAFPSKTIKKGSKGSDVTKWQKFLKWMGYSLEADGKFGSITLKRTKTAQKKFGFTGKDIDGIVGKNTVAKAKAYKKAVKKNSSVTPSTTPQRCIDVSYWQGKISQSNWEKIKKTCGYAICRASYTSQSKFALSKDSTFATNFVNAKAAGLKVGAYHYSQALTVDEAKAEAEYLCNILKDFTPTFYVAIDYEYGGRLRASTASKASEVANAFCDVIKAHGYQPIIYANTSTLQSKLKNPKYPVWVAQYKSTCTYSGKKAMWQYTSKGRVDGISASNTNNKSADVDLSYVYEVPPSQVTTAPTAKYSGSLPMLKVTKTATQVIADALKWGKWIADNNTYHYGEYGNKAYIKENSKYYEGGKYKPIYNVTHSCGCHFCGTNVSRKVKKATKLGYNGENWEHTYVCNTFVTAMYAHGGLDPTCLSKCTNGKAAGMDDKGRSSVLDNSKNWTYMGKLAIKDLKAGDVLVTASHMQCVYSPVSSKKVKIIESTSYIGKYGSDASKNSIRIKEKSPSYTSVYRFTGSVNKDISIRCGEYSDRVWLWQAFLKWAGFECGIVDGKFGDNTFEATKKFQKKCGLTEDGIVGAKTLEKAGTYTK